MTRFQRIALWLTSTLICTAAAPAADIPRKEQVGAAALPDAIAPVKAPFPMPEFRKPVFADRSIDIAAKGAKPGEKVTAAIQAAVDEVHSRGGGTVVVPKGQWHTGRITLKSHVNLRIDEGAELHFSGEVEDYRPAVFTRNEGIEVMSLGALIYANGQEHIAVTGKGRLIGPPKDCAVRKQVMNADVVEKFINHETPVEQRVYEGHDGSFIFLPMFISPINCKNVYIEGVTLENTPFWNIVPVYCNGVIIRGVTVHSVGIPRGDGIDVESSRNVLIEYCTLSCGDDCFTIKAGRGEDGLRVNKPTENVVVRYCLAREGHGGITCGSETAGMIKNLYVHDCVFDNTGVGIRFKTRRPRGGGGDGLTYERIRMNLTGTAFSWDMLGSKQYVGELATRLPAREVNRLTPVYRNITARDIVVERSSQFIKATGIPESPLTNVLIENADVTAKKLITAIDVKGLTIKNATIKSEDANVSLIDAHDVKFDNVTWNVPGGEPQFPNDRPEPGPLSVGIANHAFDHLGAIGEQTETVAASGGNIIYATGCGGVGYEGLPPADKLAEILAAAAKYNESARAQGIKLILGYVCATSIVKLDTFDKNWTSEFRARFKTPPADWRQQGKDGKPLPSWYGGHYNPACMNNPDWVEYEKYIVRQQLDSGHDGLFFDNPTVHPQGCYCPHCMTKFSAMLLSEKVIPAPVGTEEARRLASKYPTHFLRLRATTARDFLREMRQFARSVRPDALMTCNSSLNAPQVLFSQARSYGYNIYEMAKAQDLVVVEDMATQPRMLAGGTTVEYGPTLSLLHAISHGRPVVANVLAEGDYHTPPNLVRLAMAEAAAHGASYLAWPTWPQEQRQRMSAAIRPQADFLRHNANLLADARPRRNVILFLPMRRWLETERCVASELAATLRAANVQFDTVCEDNLLQTIKDPGAPIPLFLIESHSVLTADEMDAFKKWKASGGGVVAADEGKWFDELRGWVEPVEVVARPHVRAVVRDQADRTVVHLYNLGVERLSSFEDKVHPAQSVSVNVRAPFPQVRSVQLLTADEGATAGLLEFKSVATTDYSDISVVVPKLFVSSILVIEP